MHVSLHVSNKIKLNFQIQDKHQLRKLVNTQLIINMGQLESIKQKSSCVTKFEFSISTYNLQRNHACQRKLLNQMTVLVVPSDVAPPAKKRKLSSIFSNTFANRAPVLDQLKDVTFIVGNNETGIEHISGNRTIICSSI